MTRYLVVSDPPHAASPDFEACARSLGVTVAESRMKANFVAPEIWQAFPDEGAAKEAAESLHRAGLNVGVIDGLRLREVPLQRLAARFGFSDSGLEVLLAESTVELAYGTPLIGVYCKAPPVFAETRSEQKRLTDEIDRRGTGKPTDRAKGKGRERGGSQIFEALESGTFLDLYASPGGTLVRLTIARDVADFSGLGDMKRLTAADNMSVIMAECVRRFPRFRLDRRLEDVRPRGRLRVGASPPPPGRKLLSFGTVALSELLQAISVDLGALTQFELGSRLSYLMAEAPVASP